MDENIIVNMINDKPIMIGINVQPRIMPSDTTQASNCRTLDRLEAIASPLTNPIERNIIPLKKSRNIKLIVFLNLNKYPSF